MVGSAICLWTCPLRRPSAPRHPLGSLEVISSTRNNPSNPDLATERLKITLIKMVSLRHRAATPAKNNAETNQRPGSSADKYSLADPCVPPLVGENTPNRPNMHPSCLTTEYKPFRDGCLQHLTFPPFFSFPACTLPRTRVYLC